MRTRGLLASLVIVCLGYIPTLSAQMFQPFPVPNGFSCAKCGKRWILVDNLIDSTTDHPTQSITAAQTGFINQAFFAATFNCVAVLDSHRVVGPPMTDTDQWDYELWGEVSGTSPNYVVRAVLVSAADHESVAEARGHFSNLSEAITGGQFAVLDLGATANGSTRLDALLDNWEAARRSSTRPGWDIKINTLDVKNDVDAGQKQTIRIEVRDCDDELIKNAPIEVRYSGSGSMSASVITTDGSGIATVDYTAPTKSGQDDVYFYWMYKRPSGRTARATSTEVFTVGGEYRLEFDSTMNFAGMKHGVQGTFRVQGTVPLTKKDAGQNAWTYEGNATTKYTQSTWSTSEPDCSVSASGSGAPLAVKFTHSPEGSGASEMLLTVSQSMEAFTVTCKGISLGGPNALWFASFYNSHQGEISETVAGGIVLKMTGWTVSPSGSDTIATKTYAESAVAPDGNAHGTTTLKITKAAETPPRHRAVGK